MTELMNENAPTAFVRPTFRAIREEYLGSPNPAGYRHHGAGRFVEKDVAADTEHANKPFEESGPAWVVRRTGFRVLDPAEGPSEEES